MREWVSINGLLMPADQARVSVFDSGFMQGVGLFETMRAYHGRVFRLAQHVQRLARSAQALRWTVPPDVGRMTTCVEQVVGATEQADARVRLTVTTGTLRPTDQEQPELTIVASATPGMQYPPETYAKGVTVVLSSCRQNPFDPTTGHKTTSYFARLAALREAHARGAFEALWFTREGRLAEGSISSVFAVHDHKLITPPLDTPILPGITRAAVLELAGRLGIAAGEQAMTVDDLLAADECFLTNSMIELVPVVRLEREPIGAEKPGELTQRLAQAYRDLVRQECGDE